MQTASAPADLLAASLEEIRNTPLDGIAAWRVREVVERVQREPRETAADVAAFDSAI